VVSGVAMPALAAALSAVGQPNYLGCLIDLIGTLASHDRITAVRYSTATRPEFLAHRNFSDALANRYLEVYYPYDPFYAYWRDNERPGIVPLRRFTTREFKQGIYIAEFLFQSVIVDEVGVLLRDGEGTALAIFLERSQRRFSASDIERLEDAFPSLAAIHALHRRLAAPEPKVKPSPVEGKPVARLSQRLPDGLWSELTQRERDVIELILAGHPSSGIAERLRISPGTVRIHRQSIYAKLDITTEREIFLQYIDFMAGVAF
jgi:DNA-binding CsgD family transcriptional regulator